MGDDKNPALVDTHFDITVLVTLPWLALQIREHPRSQTGQ